MGISHRERLISMPLVPLGLSQMKLWRTKLHVKYKETVDKCERAMSSVLASGSPLIEKVMTFSASSLRTVNRNGIKM